MGEKWAFSDPTAKHNFHRHQIRILGLLKKTAVGKKKHAARREVERISRCSDDDELSYG